MAKLVSDVFLALNTQTFFGFAFKVFKKSMTPKIFNLFTLIWVFKMQNWMSNPSTTVNKKSIGKNVIVCKQI